MKKKSEPKDGVSRRDFLKLTSATAAVGATAVVAPEAQAAALFKEHDKFPLELRPDYKRFPQRNTIFMRAASGHEPKITEYAIAFDQPKFTDKPGWTQLDKALDRAAWTVHDEYSPDSAGGAPNTPAFKWDREPAKQKYKFENKKEASQIIKRASTFLGASLVGITPYDERWVYEFFYDPEHDVDIPVKFPFKPKSVIVMALEMDYDNFTTAPSWIASAGAGKQYSRMAFMGASVANFINQLGYRAFGTGNDVALSVPYAIAAGLGELGRNGSLITFKYGPRVRLCKVFTELELEYDKPVTFGVKEFCSTCKRCAEACPSKAISFADEPNFDIPNKSNNPGVAKWAMDAEKCFKFWGENGGDCGACITSCVYSKPDLWHHRMMAAMSAVPGGPVHSVMTEMDRIFGYGNTYDDKAIRKWWKG